MNPSQALLSSHFVWNLTGLSYPLAVLATRGCLLTVSDYLHQSKMQMMRLEDQFGGNERVLEFGCGIGGNLLAVSDEISFGVGVDVNSGFIRIATRLADMRHKQNIRFLGVDNLMRSFSTPFDFAFSIGVFERLSIEQVRNSLQAMSQVLRPDGRVAAYFLSDRHIGTRFATRLGTGAYVAWTRPQILEVMGSAGFRIVVIHDWLPIGGGTESVADLAVGVKR
jgi:cyclopropane fatty-acyl-phospholipid synthase-like methyltransferase